MELYKVMCVKSWRETQVRAVREFFVAIRGAKGDDGRVSERVGCCVIVAFRAAKGVRGQNHSFRGAKGDNGRVSERGGRCVIVAFRSAKGLRSQFRYFAERKTLQPLVIPTAACMKRVQKGTARE